MIDDLEGSFNQEGRRLSRSDPLSRHALPRWQTRFGRWVDDVGVNAIVAELRPDPSLRCTSKAVRQWLKGHAPRPERARALVQFSQRIERPISLDAIYSHRFELEDLRRRDAGVGGAV